MIDVLEYRLDWAAMHFTPELFRYVLLKMLPDVILHTARQDEEQIRDNYDRECARRTLLHNGIHFAWPRSYREAEPKQRPKLEPRLERLPRSFGKAREKAPGSVKCPPGEGSYERDARGK